MRKNHLLIYPFLVALAAGSSADGQIFTYSGSIETYTIPATGTYIVSVSGAQGGGDTTYHTNGGRGAFVSGDVLLTQGTVLDIVVGQQGQSSPGYAGGGGGGGSFVYIAGATQPLAVAGGGGGGSYIGCSGGVGSNSTTGQNGAGADSANYQLVTFNPKNAEYFGSGGSSGSGGAGGVNPVAGGYNGGGGGGWLGDGSAGIGGGGGGSGHAALFLAGTGGGFNSYGSGGFGGGGGGGYYGGGGGGGYSGGGGGAGGYETGYFYGGGGGGGGSYLASSLTSTFQDVAENTGNGEVSIYAVPEPGTLALAGGSVVALVSYCRRSRCRRSRRC
jgi:hypothetical protein